MKKNLLLKKKISLFAACLIFSGSAIVKAQTIVPYTEFTYTANCTGGEDWGNGVSAMAVFCGGDYFEYDFEATKVALYGCVHNNDTGNTEQEATGRADIYIDGVLASPEAEGVLFWTKDAPLVDVKVWESNVLSAGEIHNIQVVTRGDWISVTKLEYGTGPFTSVSQTAAMENDIVIPNPGNGDNLIIKLNSAQYGSLSNIKISDITGKELYNKNVTGKEVHLNNLNLPKGINIITISNNNSTQSLKYIVK